MPALTRSGQPRRRGQGSSEGFSRHKSSWELLARNRRGSNADENAMDIDGASTLSNDNKSAESFPLRSMAERVGEEVEEYAESLDEFKVQHATTKYEALVELIGKYKAVAEKTIELLEEAHKPQLRQKFRQNYTKRYPSAAETPEETDFPTSLADLERAKAELYTWQLFQKFLELENPDVSSADAGYALDNDRFRQDGMPWWNFIHTSEVARERLIVLAWLESTAENTGSDVEFIEQELGRKLSDNSSLLSHGWMDTCQRIKGEKRLRSSRTNSDAELVNIRGPDGIGQLVTQLDPDAVTRQGNSLEKSDEAFETAIWTLCWEMLRRGFSMKQIRDWCAERNQLALALSFGTPSGDDEEGDDFQRRWLWRKSCAAASEKGRKAHERGVYGLLSGVTRSALPVCKSWFDVLYVTYTSRLLKQYESFLAINYGTNFSEEDLGSFNGPVVYAVEHGREDAARAAAKEAVAYLTGLEEPMTPFESLQKALIEHYVPNLIFRLGVALARKVDKKVLVEFRSSEPADLPGAIEKLPPLMDDPAGLRVVAHMYLIYKEMGFTFGTGKQLKAAENVLCQYIQYLRFSGKIRLIPLYASHLSSETATYVLGRCLASITATSQEQQDMITLMQSCNIDVPHVLTYQARMAIQYSDPPIKVDGQTVRPQLLEAVSDNRWPGYRLKPLKQGNIVESDETLIRAMEWYLLVEGGWGRMFQSLTEISIAFLKSSRVHAALELFQRLPFADISVSKKPGSFKQPVDILDDSDSEEDKNSEDAAEDSSPPALRHSASLAFRSQHHNYKNFGVPVRQIAPERIKVHRALYKAHARTYFELGQLVDALRRLYAWREAEEVQAERERERDTHHGDHPDSGLADIRQECRKRLDALVRAMEPLLHEFLTQPAPGVEPGVLRDLRRAYVPQMILAYTAALHSGAFLLGRERMLQCMDLATDVAANEQLIADIKAVGEMPRLVDAFARASKGMLRLNERASKASSKKRTKNGKSYGIWELP